METEARKLRNKAEGFNIKREEAEWDCKMFKAIEKEVADKLKVTEAELKQINDRIEELNGDD